MSQENVELVRAAWEAWERGDTKALFAFYDPEIVWDQTHYEAGELSNVYHGHDGIKHFFRQWLAPFESYYAHAEDFVDAHTTSVRLASIRARSAFPSWSEGDAAGPDAFG